MAAQMEPEAFSENLRVPGPPESPHLAPSFWLSREDAVQAQLQALHQNNFPYGDHGIEVLYRFAGFDPWQRSTYFGRSLDLGQFERFRRILYTKCFTALVGHTESQVLSQLEVAEDVWKVRVLVKNGYRKEEGVYEFTMQRRFGGKYDGEIRRCLPLHRLGVPVFNNVISILLSIVGFFHSLRNLAHIVIYSWSQVCGSAPRFCVTAVKIDTYMA